MGRLDVGLRAENVTYHSFQNNLLTSCSEYEKILRKSKFYGLSITIQEMSADQFRSGIRDLYLES